MNRQELYTHIHSTVHQPLGAALALIHDRCSPEAGGYHEFADGEGAHPNRTEEEWRALDVTPEQREMYKTWLRLLHDSKSLAKGLMCIRDEKSSLDLTLEILALRLSLLDKLQDALNPTVDQPLIQQLGMAHQAADELIAHELRVAS